MVRRLQCNKYCIAFPEFLAKVASTRTQLPVGLYFLFDVPPETRRVLPA